MVNIFLEIYALDISTKRRGILPRNICVNAYLNEKNYSVWKKYYLIEKLADFVTWENNRWTLKLTPVEYKFTIQESFLDNLNANNVSLISGGLDFFCGTYYNEKDGYQTLYCGYKTSNVDTSTITRVSNFLNKRKGNIGVLIYSRINERKVVFTQRTRSLLFFSLAVITAVKENICSVNVNENGIMALLIIHFCL